MPQIDHFDTFEAQILVNHPVREIELEGILHRLHEQPALSGVLAPQRRVAGFCRCVYLRLYCQ